MALLPTNPEQLQLSIISSSDPIFQLIGRIIQLAFGLAGGIALIYLLIGAFQYFTAYGSEEKATKAKTTITYAIIGIVVIILAEVIITIVWNFITPEPITLPK